jgi:uncharacterized membrane protein YqjE
MIAETEKSARTADGHVNIATASKRVANRILAIAENRFELALVEIQEERERILRSIWFAMVALVCVLLAGVTLTAVIALAFWGNHPIAALLALMALYLSVAGIFFFRLMKLQRNWETLPATIEQMRKDRECLEKNLS